MIDETGHKYGKLTVLERDFTKKNSNKITYQLCKCDCGNNTIVRGSKLRNGETKSCGCLRKEKAKNNAIDIINQRFGKLLVLNREGSTSNGLALQKCKCDCGNETIVAGSNLRNGHTTSCGCLRNEVSHNIHISDLTNQKFGKLTAIERTLNKKNTYYLQKCRCDCGNECEVDVNSLTQGKVSSCGCLSKSLGEEIIQQILTQNNIPFIREKSFKTCFSEETGRVYRFDFYITDKKYLIEFDGKQHFSFVSLTNGQNTKENYLKTKINDERKNQQCKKNNIKLIRIPYTEIKNLTIQDLIPETSKYLI